MKLSHILAAFLVALLPVHSVAQNLASWQVQLKKTDRIIFFGDSLTALAIKDPNVPEGKGYVPLVRAALRDAGVEVDAVATGGHKVTDLLKRVDRDVLAKKPTIVVIQIGVNDASAGVTPEQFRTQLEELIGKLQNGGSQVIQCTCTCRIEGYNPENPMDQKLDALAEVARLIGRQKQLPLVDLRKAFIDYWKTHNPENKPKGFLTYDGNHWTETGHRYVAEQMLKKFKL
jgi:lysophospholipase L1-like esterase